MSMPSCWRCVPRIVFVSAGCSRKNKRIMRRAARLTLLYAVLFGTLLFGEIETQLEIFGSTSPVPIGFNTMASKLVRIRCPPLSLDWEGVLPNACVWPAVSQ
jgi:hypothetical protein